MQTQRNDNSGEQEEDSAAESSTIINVFQGVCSLSPFREASQLSKEEIAKWYSVPWHEAVAHLRVDEFALKKRCRELGIRRWPFRKRKSAMVTSQSPREQTGCYFSVINPTAKKSRLHLPSSEDSNASNANFHTSAASSSSSSSTSFPSSIPPPSITANLVPTPEYQHAYIEQQAFRSPFTNEVAMPFDNYPPPHLHQQQHYQQQAEVEERKSLETTPPPQLPSIHNVLESQHFSPVPQLPLRFPRLPVPLIRFPPPPSDNEPNNNS